VAGCFLVAMVVGWTRVAAQIDDYVYDFLLRINPPEPIPTHAVTVAIDDASFAAFGGIRRERHILTEALERIATAHPKAVAIDIILHDRQDAAEDEPLARALAKIDRLVLATDLTRGGWEDPEPAFMQPGATLAHVYADENPWDGVTRSVRLEWRAYRTRRWALGFQAYLASIGATPLETLKDLQVGNEVIPARYADMRPLRILYAPDSIPSISVVELVKNPEVAKQLKDKVVFLGVTSSSFTRDRIHTPFGGDPIPGLEAHAQTFETLERGRFLVDAENLTVPLMCAVIALIAGLVFAFLAGWPSYVAGAALLGAVHIAPFWLFRHGIVFPYTGPLATAWLACFGAAAYQSLVVRRQLRRSEVERARYRQAIHFVTHEMRSPLTAIQGSSELMGRYNLNEEKRKQIAGMINSESKRLARMIQTFLDVERLADGQMELKREPIAIPHLVQACLERARPLAERKNIVMTSVGVLEGEVLGDRELMEYAVYNLLTNAVKYSAADTEITISTRPDAGFLRLSIKDQGMGMDAHELKQIFTRFYRTKRAEASGEAGTGIGLSIVDQIVTSHGGRMEVSSEPGKGSCFTMVVPAFAVAAQGRRAVR